MKFDNIIGSSDIKNIAQNRNLKKFMKIFSDVLLLVDLNRVNLDMSYVKNREGTIEIYLAHKDGFTNFTIKIDQYEILVYLDHNYYSMFQISNRVENEFYTDVKLFLINIINANYHSFFYYKNGQVIKSELSWKNKIYPNRIEVSGFLNLLLDSFGKLRFNNTTQKNYSKWI